MASITLDQSNPKLGDTVTFTYDPGNLKGNQSPRIYVAAFQDVDGDGAIDYVKDVDGNGVPDDLVYGETGPAAQGYLLGGSMSEWLQRGGPAKCKATLYYWDWHPRQTFVFLAECEFDAAG